MTYKYIDPAPFQRLIQLAANSRHPALKTSLEQAPAEIEMICEQVLAAMAASRRDHLQDLAHRMKGMAATLGAYQLKEMAAALMSPDAAIDSRVQNKLREICNETRDEITRLLKP